MTTDAAIATRAPRKGFRLGLWTLILGLLAPAWALSAFYLAIWSGSGHDFPGQVTTFPAWATVPVYILVVTAFLVVPVSTIAAFILGILALRRNVVLGMVLAVIGLLPALVFTVGLIVTGLTFFGSFSF